MPSFQDFIAPFDAAEFKAKTFGRRPLHLPAHPARAANPLPWARLNEVLALGTHWTEDTLKVLYRNRHALRENYCDVSTPGERGPARVDAKKLQAMLGLGASLVANQMQRVCPQIDAVCRMLQREFAAASGANVYCSFEGVQAFGTHFDLHEVFAYQAEGEKLWHVYESRADHPVVPVPPGDEAERWLTQSRGKLLFEVLMRPGDLLYLPRGQYHDAITGSAASLHVTYYVKPATGLALFKLLESALAAESDFRADLPDAADAAALKTHLERLARHVDRCLQSPAFALDVANHQRALAGSQAVPFGLPRRERPRFFTTVRPGRVVRSGEGFVARFDGAELPLGAAYPAVQWLLGQRLFSFEDLAARHAFIDADDLQRVLAQLAQLGVVDETEMR